MCIRDRIRKYFTDIGIRPRPASLRAKGVREVHPHLTWNYYEDLAGHMVGKNLHSGLTFFMNSGAYTELSVNPRFERIGAPFRIAPGIAPIPAGSYGWTEYQLKGSSDPSRAISGDFIGIVGGLWSGTQRTINASLTIRPSYRFYLETRLQRTAGDLDIPDAEFTKTFGTLRANYSFSTGMFVDALVQYDPGSEQINSNVRFNLIHHPLSDIFLVFNEQRFRTEDSVLPGRSVALKGTWMVAF